LRCGPSLSNQIAAIKDDGEQSPHPLNPINRSAGQRSVAIVLGKGNEEICLWAIAGEAEIRREVITRRDWWSAYRD
jgi:hypothetical protein